MTRQIASDVEPADDVDRTSLPPDLADVPRYLRDLANSRLNRLNRHSRASSLVSVSTKFTTNTLNEDARSIDLVLAGQYFRIARDGSRVSDSAPPAYSSLYSLGTLAAQAQPPPSVSPSRSEFSIHTSSGRSLDTAFVLSSDEEEDSSVIHEEGFATPRQQSPTRSPDTAIRGSRLPFDDASIPSESSHSRPQTALAVINDELPDRRPSYKSGVENLDVVAVNRRLSRADDYYSRLTPLRRRNGVRLPSLDTHIRHALDRATSALQGRQRSRSAGPVLEQGASHEVGLGTSILYEETRSGALPSRTLGRNFTSPFPFALHEDPDEAEDAAGPLSMDDENDISLHYAGMMRRLDRDHRRVIQSKDHEITLLKQQLDEKDHVYRQQLRARDFIIDDLSQQLRQLQQQLLETEQSIDSKIEKAIFKTEDIWEARWKDQEFHLREKIEEDAQRRINAILGGQASEQADAT